jgi:hypothetical protein
LWCGLNVSGTCLADRSVKVVVRIEFPVDVNDISFALCLGHRFDIAIATTSASTRPAAPSPTTWAVFIGFRSCFGTASTLNRLIKVDQSCAETAGDHFVARFIAGESGLFAPWGARVSVASARLA